MIEFGHLTHVGLRRTLNEDTYYGDCELGLWLIADGMGGHRHGEMASALARETIVREIQGNATLTAAIQAADTEILDFAKRCVDHHPMGSTVVVACIKRFAYEVAWVGDSRAYLWQDQRLIGMNAILESSAKNGANAPYQKKPPTQNAIIQALGVTDPADLNVSVVSGELSAGTQLLLCSDGLTEELNDRHIAAILRKTDFSAQECVDMLIAAALDRGGSDNITAILIRRH